jgi:Ca2+-binding EF-hand superfamily protein
MFAEADPLTQVTLELVSHTLGSLQVQQFREEFQAIDTTHLGSITRKEFLAAFHSCADVRFKF